MQNQHDWWTHGRASDAYSGRLRFLLSPSPPPPLPASPTCANLHLSPRVHVPFCQSKHGLGPPPPPPPAGGHTGMADGGGGGACG